MDIHIDDIIKSLPKDKYIIKLIPAQNRHSVPIYAPKKWEGKRVLLLVLEDD